MGFHIVHNVKTLFLELAQILVLEDHEILILLQLFHNAFHTGNVFVDLSLDERTQQRLPHFLDALQCLIVVVNIDQAADHALLPIFPDSDVQIRLVKKIERHQIPLVIDGVHQTVVFQHAVNGDLTEICPEIPVFIVDMAALHAFLIGHILPVKLR